MSETCPVCYGAGAVEQREPCQECHGQGEYCPPCPACDEEMRVNLPYGYQCDDCELTLTTKQVKAIEAHRDAAIEEAVKPWREALTDDLTVFDYIVTADKTRYDYPPGGHGQVAKAIACKPDGTPPPTGQAWLTPKEKAEARIKVLRALLNRGQS